jgi:hypothetical protein
MGKSELLYGLQEKNRQWEELLDRIGPARMDQPGVNGTWSMKDMVAHLTGWNRWLVNRMQAAQRGEPEPAPPWPAHLHDEDEINAWIFETYRQIPASDVLKESSQVFQRLYHVIESLPEDVRVECIEPAYYTVWLNDQSFLASEFFDHFHDDHAADVVAWLAQAV